MKTKNTFSAKAVKTKLRAGLGLYAQTAALTLEAYAKTNAPWWPQGPSGGKTGPPGYRHTGDARNSIQAEWGWKGDHLIVTVSGNMKYSVYLELANEKKYAILYPTIQKLAPSILKAYRRF